jgi:hypothetical protein
VTTTELIFSWCASAIVIFILIEIVAGIIIACVVTRGFDIDRLKQEVDDLIAIHKKNINNAFPYYNPTLSPKEIKEKYDKVEIMQEKIKELEWVKEKIKYLEEK